MIITTFKKAVFTLFALNIFVFANCQYQEDSLLQYLKIAGESNPAVLQKLNEYQASLEKVVQSGSLNDPELSVGVFLSPMELISGNQVADIRLMQMFPWFGVLRNAKDEMSLMAMSRYQSFMDTKWQVYYEVQKTWYLLFRIKEEIRISEENLEILHTIERIGITKFKAVPIGGNSNSTTGGKNPESVQPSSSAAKTGMQSMGNNNPDNSADKPGLSENMQSSSMAGSGGGAGLADLYRIQIETGDLENSIALLRNNLKTITVRFNLYLNRPDESPVFLPAQVHEDSLGIPVDAISDSILQNNPMLKMYRYEQQSLDARKTMVDRMSYPMMGLGLNYSIINSSDMSASPMNGKDMIMPMVTITLPVYRKKYRAMSSETYYLKEGMIQEYQSASNALQNEYYEAVRLFEDANRRMKLYLIQSQLAQNTLNIAIRSFAASGTELTDVLKIRQQALEYEVKRINALTDYNTAIARLKQLMADNQTNMDTIMQFK